MTPSKIRYVQLIYPLVCLIFILLLGCKSAYSQAQTIKTTDTFTAQQIVANVRKAVGYDKVQKLRHGFAIEEIRESPDSSNTTIRMFGRAGEVRQEAKSLDTNTFVFDGKELWMINRVATSSRNGSPYPVNQKQLEKLVLPWWIQSAWWLDANAPLDIAVLPDESNELHVAISIKFKNGVVGSKLLIDRTNWLPAALRVEQAKGFLTIEFKDYKKTILGFLYPRRSKVNYDNSDKEFKIKSIVELPATDNLFRRLPPPADATFDNSTPAKLKLGQGAPFPDGSKGHPTYVRPLVDGKDVGWFHFDTGADNMMIDSKLADELGMPIVGESEAVSSDGNVRKVTIRKGKTFQLGRVTIKDPIYVADDLSKMNAPPGEKRAGFCGYPLLVRAIVEIIHGGESIALYDPSTYQLNKGKWQNLFLINYKPTVMAHLEGNRKGLFMLDTGHSTTADINSEFSRQNRLLEGRKTVEEMASGSGGDYKNLIGTLEWFELAGYKFKNPKVLFRIKGVGYETEDVSGVVGREFMKPFTIVFNYSERRVAFIR